MTNQDRLEVVQFGITALRDVLSTLEKFYVGRWSEAIEEGVAEELLERGLKEMLLIIGSMAHTCLPTRRVAFFSFLIGTGTTYLGGEGVQHAKAD